MQKTDQPMAPVIHQTGPSMPVGCICGYTWSGAGQVRNGPLASCPADHGSDHA